VLSHELQVSKHLDGVLKCSVVSEDGDAAVESWVDPDDGHRRAPVLRVNSLA
jgi:hypothetical protein